MTDPQHVKHSHVIAATHNGADLPATASAEAPYANGNGHAALEQPAAPGAPAAAAAAPAAAPAPARDPLEDLLSLSPVSQPEPPKPGLPPKPCAPAIYLNYHRWPYAHRPGMHAVQKGAGLLCIEPGLCASIQIAPWRAALLSCIEWGSQPLTVVAAVAAPSAYDPFGVSGDPHALMGGPPPEIRPTGDIAAWYRKLCIAASGVLYEDTYLQARPCSITF